MQVHLCGVRGSAPAPGPSFASVGGHTSCVAVAEDDRLPSLVLDAGTGLRNVSALLGAVPFDGTIVLGHVHWDHIMGIPFFTAGDRPDARVRVLLPDQGIVADDLMARLMEPPLFPITTADLRGDWTFATYGEGAFSVGPFTVVAREIPHKGGRTMGLRVTDGSSTLAYLSDHAPHDLGPGDDGLGALHAAAVELAAGADLLIHDAQYTAAELPGRATWGHSAAPYCVTLAAHCRVERVLLFHHDPGRSDEQAVALRDEMTEFAGGRTRVELATEGTVIRV